MVRIRDDVKEIFLSVEALLLSFTAHLAICGLTECRLFVKLPMRWIQKMDVLHRLQ